LVGFAQLARSVVPRKQRLAVDVEASKPNFSLLASCTLRLASFSGVSDLPSIKKPDREGNHRS
jgi:hypothetical protein